MALTQSRFMFAEDVRADVQQFLLEHIETHEELAAILLLRSKSEQTWNASELALELKIPAEAANEALEHLVVHGLVALENRPERPFKYAPKSQELSERVDRLADAYRDHWLGVMKVLSNNAMLRVRTSAMRAFADSFVVDGKKGPHD